MRKLKFKIFTRFTFRRNADIFKIRYKFGFAFCLTAFVRRIWDINLTVDYYCCNATEKCTFLVVNKTSIPCILQNL